MLRTAILLFVMQFVLSGCGSYETKSPQNPQGTSVFEDLPPTENPLTDTPLDLSKISYRWNGKHPDANEWTEITADAMIEMGLLEIPIPQDIEAFCPNFRQLTKNDQLLFWIYLFSAMVERESYFRPQTTYQEAFNDVNGDPIISRGLLQLSIESSKGYGCPLKNAQELHDPAINLHCGARIFTRWVRGDQVVSAKTTKWLGGARYWAVLRTPTVDTIKGWTKNIPLCRTGS